MRKTFCLGVLTAAVLFSTGSARAAEPGSCAPAGGLNFICGLENPEDLVLIPNTRWIIVSSMAPGGGLHAVDSDKKTARQVFPAAARVAHDKSLYGNCPGPVEAAKAAFHGLSLRAAQGGRYKLYATQHGSRESIEVFEVETSAGTPAVTWVGCVTMPDQLAANSVSSFSDGTILATVLIHPGKTFGDSLAKRNTGAVYQWKPGTIGFQMIPGTELPSNNGIDVSPDDREFYVVSSGLQQVVVYSRDIPAKVLRRGQFVEFTPDNVHWTSDGRLISAGMIDNEPACGGPPKADANGGLQNLTSCPRGFMAATVDPKTMKVTEVARGPATPAFSAAASAVLVGSDIWVSSFHADRLAYRTLK
jgi:SMP-30/Gluconolactonase/LRE-like region